MSIHQPRPGHHLGGPARAPISTILGRFGWAVVLVVGLLLFEVVHAVYRVTGNVRLIPGLLLVGALTPLVATLAGLYGSSLRPRTSGFLLVAVAAISGVLSISVAALLEYRTQTRLGELPPLTVAVIEESSKLAVPAIVAVAIRARHPLDGLTVGVCSGAGFAVLETLGYSAQQLVTAHDRLPAVDGTLLDRGLFAPATHVAWTGMAVAGLWLALARRTGRAWLTFVALLALAVTLHTAWDALGSVAAALLLSLASVGALTAVGHALARQEPT